MTANQYRSALDKLGLTQAGAAEFLGVSIRTSHGYANGVPIPEGYAKLLRLMVRLNLKPTTVHSQGSQVYNSLSQEQQEKTNG